jgi:hypothetical protein
MLMFGQPSRRSCVAPTIITAALLRVSGIPQQLQKYLYSSETVVMLKNSTWQ